MSTYRLVLFENKVKLKILYKCKRLTDARKHLKSLSSEKAFVPKKTAYKNNKKLVPVKHEILLLKKWEEGDEIGVIKDVNDDGWVIVDKAPYEVEELYTVTGVNRKLTGEEILDHIILKGGDDDGLKQVFILNNKIIIDGLDLYMVTCKNTGEATRLYNAIRIYCYDNKVRSILFFGRLGKASRGDWYKKIHERTGVGFNRLYRLISR